MARAFREAARGFSASLAKSREEWKKKQEEEQEKFDEQVELRRQERRELEKEERERREAERIRQEDFKIWKEKERIKSDIAKEAATTSFQRSKALKDYGAKWKEIARQDAFELRKKLIEHRGEIAQEEIESRHLSRQIIAAQQRAALQRLEQAKDEDEFMRWGYDETQKLAVGLSDKDADFSDEVKQSILLNFKTYTEQKAKEKGFGDVKIDWPGMPTDEFEGEDPIPGELDIRFLDDDYEFVR